MPNDKPITTKKKPCPFCGGTKLMVCETDYAGERKAYAVTCLTKLCHGNIWALGFGHFKTEKKAINEWNRRPK